MKMKKIEKINPIQYIQKDNLNKLKHELTQKNEKKDFEFQKILKKEIEKLK